MPAPAADGVDVRTDVLIRGAGPVGCALALALRESGLRTAIFAKDATPGAFRPIALSHASRLILERLDAWTPKATPIETVHVSQQGGFGRTRMKAADAGVPALGYVVDYSVLTALLRTRVEREDIAIAQDELPARCTVHAEGSAGEQEEKRYSQDALVGLVRMARPAGTTAYERFTPEGPLALLPFGRDYALVWSASPARARVLAGLPADGFLRELAAAAGGRFGEPSAIESRSVQPLALRVRRTRTAERAVYIGNAAQTLHPVAGQGLNLGLRDAWELARILRDAKDPGDPAVLARYERRRALDAFATIRATDLLARGFAGSGRFGRSARGIALTFLDVLPAPRRFIARRMIYGPSALP
jgi:2-octaprenyl-6-methoxyphenol hydroxylase